MLAYLRHGSGLDPNRRITPTDAPSLASERFAADCAAAVERVQVAAKRASVARNGVLMASLAASEGFWQVVLFPVLFVAWVLVGFLLILLLPVQIVTTLVSRKGFFSASPFRELFLVITQGVDRRAGSFDHRFVALHPQMSWARFREIYFQKREFRVTPRKLRIAAADEVLVPSLGHLQPDARYDVSRVEDFIPVPSAMVGRGGDYVALVITNQGGLGVGVPADEYLVFRRQESVSGSGPWTVLLPNTATLRRLPPPPPDPPLTITGQFVGSVPRTPANS